jgi:inorganic pyrophosphatase
VTGGRHRQVRREPIAPAQRFRPHPWHGLAVGPRPPEILNAFIEITPFDLMKYEVDPLDICVLSERTIARNEIIVRCRVIGGVQMIDGGEADDKIISVLENDYVWGAARNVRDVPSVLVERLEHYFLTYKLVPGARTKVRIARVYGRAHALKVVRAAMADYDDAFGESAS